MSEPAAVEAPPLSEAELEVVRAVQAMFEAIGVCEAAGGDANRAFLAAIPPETLAEAKRQFPLLGFLGL